MKFGKIKEQNKIELANMPSISYTTFSDDVNYMLMCSQNVESGGSGDTFTCYIVKMLGNKYTFEEKPHKINEENVTNFFLYDIQMRGSSTINLLYLTWKDTKTWTLKCISDTFKLETIQKTQTYKALEALKFDESYYFPYQFQDFHFRFINDILIMNYKNNLEYIDARGNIKTINAL